MRLCLDCSVLVGAAAQARLQLKLPVDHAVAELASARCGNCLLATRNIKDFPLRLGGVLHPYEL